jgi:hypothetical protein
MRKYYTLLSVLVCLITCLNAQNGDPAQRFEQGKEMLKATDLSIPTSPAYFLLDASTSLIATPSVTRNVKVDWAFRSYSLSPNFAIEIQPIWEALYNRPYLRKYRNDSPFQRMMSTLSFSVGAFQREINNDSLRIVKEVVQIVPRESIKKWFMSAAFKLTLYREFDPLLADAYYKPLEIEYTTRKLKYKRELMQLKMQIDSTAAPEDTIQIAVQKRIRNVESEEDSYESVHMEKLKNMRKQYQADHWNGAMVEVAYGKIGRLETLTTISDSQAIISRKLMDDGAGVWISACKGIGTTVLISGNIRYIGDFSKKNRTSVGANIRYGGTTYNSYVEAFYDMQPQATIKANQKLWHLGFGGDWRMNNILNLSFGLRTSVNKNGQMLNLVPVVNLSCLMR